MTTPPASPSASTCAKCSTPLAEGAMFCHRCGSATPIELSPDGQAMGPQDAGPSAVQDAAHRRRLQTALGPTVELRDLLGRGGFAEVYVAYDKRLKRELAVKTLRPDLVVSDTLLQRFQREAEAVAKLRHPNVIPIYTVGEGEGIAYFIMPRIEGESVAAVIEREGKLPVEEAGRILREAASALGAAHRQGIIHRDVKPDNIMLEGPDRRTLVMDFGIAKTAEPTERGLTGTGTLVGTPHYMSPEQATGERDLDHRSDQYSLAMVGFHMLTGKLAFDADSIQTLIFKLVTQPAARASDVAPDVPDAVSDVLARALAKRPDDRYPSMEAFAAAVAAATAPAAPAATLLAAEPQLRREEPVAARVARLRGELPSWRHPLVLAAVVALVALVALLWRDPPGPALELAANRGEAYFAARSFLNARGVPNARKVTQTFETDAPAYTFLQRALGREAAERRARSEIPVWAWHIKLEDPARDERWVVHVGPDNRVWWFTAPSRDTSYADSTDSTAVRALALRELAALGWSPDSLVLVSDSGVRHGAHTDRTLRWRRAGVVVPWRGADTATAQLHTTFSGKHLSSYRQRLAIPASYTREFRGQSTGMVSRLAGLVLLGLAIYAFVQAISRQRVDAMQWKMAKYTTAALALLLAPQLIVAVMGNVSSGSGESTAGSGDRVFGRVVGPGIAIVLGVGCFIMALAVAESLSHQQRPQVYSGLRELSNGRAIIPEVVTAAAWGVPVGLLLALLPFAGQWVEARLGWDIYETGVNEAFNYAFPIVAILMFWALGAGLGAILPYMVALPRQWRLPLGAAVAIPGLLMLAIVGDSKASIGTGVGFAISFALMAWVAWRHGVLAAMVAGAVGFALPPALHLLHAGTGDYIPSALLGLAVVAAPAALAVAASRRLMAKN